MAKLKRLLLLGLALLLVTASACRERPVSGELDYTAPIALLALETVAEGVTGVVYRRVENLAALLGRSKEPVLLALYQPTDPVAVLYIPVLEQMAAELDGRLQIVLLDVSREEKIAESFAVDRLPQFTLLVGAAVKKSLVGFAEQGKEQLEELTRPYLN